MQKKDIRIFNLSLKLSVIATALWSGTLAVLLTDIINNYSLVGTQQGLMSSMISIGALVALITTIIFQGKVKKTQVIILGGLFTSLVLIIQSIPMAFVLFLLACLVMGFGHGATDSYQSAFLADLNPDNTVRQMGALHAIFGIGGMLTPIILHELLDIFQWRGIYIIVGTVCFILIAQFAVITQYMKQKSKIISRIEPKLTKADIKEFSRNKRSIFLLFTLFFGAAAQSGIIIWTIRYVSVSLGNPGIAAICLAIFWITTTLSRFFSPLLPFSPSQIIAFGAFVSAIVWTIALVINLPIGIAIAGGITGLVSGSCIPMSVSEGAAINPEKTGFSTSILMIFKTLAQILSPIVVAYVMFVGGMQIGMFVTSVLFIFNGIFAVLLIGKKQSHNNDDSDTANA